MSHRRGEKQNWESFSWIVNFLPIFCTNKILLFILLPVRYEKSRDYSRNCWLMNKPEIILTDQINEQVINYQNSCWFKVISGYNVKHSIIYVIVNWISLGCGLLICRKTLLKTSLWALGNCNAIGRLIVAALHLTLTYNPVQLLMCNVGEALQKSMFSARYTSLKGSLLVCGEILSICFWLTWC